MLCVYLIQPIDQALFVSWYLRFSNAKHKKNMLGVAKFVNFGFVFQFSVCAQGFAF